MPQSFGDNLKEARKRRGLRVKDVAARTSARISPSYLSCIENDLRLPSEELLLELADILGLDRRDLYMQLVRVKAPASIRNDVLLPPEVSEQSYTEIKQLSLESLVDRAAEAADAQRETQRLRRELSRLEKAALLKDSGAIDRWEVDASRFRMSIEKTVFHATISLDGHMALDRHVVGLTPRAGMPPIVSIQHTVQIQDGVGTTEDDSFKLLESPEDVPVEIDRRDQGPEQSVLRLLFPDGLRHEPGKSRRVSYTVRSVLRNAYSMETTEAERRADSLSDDKGARSTFKVFVDKPNEELQIEIKFPQYYVPVDLQAWAGTQEFYETDDNFIDTGVCESWDLRRDEDFSVILKITKPIIGMKFAIVWRPIYRDELDRVRRRLETEGES